jgi:hypothetical protein
MTPSMSGSMWCRAMVQGNGAEAVTEGFGVVGQAGGAWVVGKTGAVLGVASANSSA